MAVKPIPDGYHSITPYLIVEGAGRLIDFARQVFGAEETFRMDGPNGTIGHAEMRIGDSMLMLGDAGPENPPQRATLLVYAEDCDAAYRKALAAGGTSEREPADQFYGDRSAGVEACGVVWWIHTHIEDVPPEEMAKRAAGAMSS